MPPDRGARDLPAVGVGEQDLAREDDLALGVEGLEGLGRRHAELRPCLDPAVGDLFVGDLGAAGQRRDLAEALGEGAYESRPGRGLSRREEGAGVLGANVVGQLLALGQEDDRLALADAGDLEAEVPGERDGLNHPGGDRVEVRHRSGTVSARLGSVLIMSSVGFDR